VIGPLSGPQQQEAARWLQLGVFALALAGLFAILLVLSRAPVVGDWFPWIDFFRTALVVHVDQSVLIWFLAMAGVICSLTAASGRLFGDIAFWLSLAGTLGIAASAFVGDGAPLMNNYIPVLQRPLFFVALALVGMGVVLRLLLLLPGLRPSAWFKSDTGERQVVAFTVAAAVLGALLAILHTWIAMPSQLDGTAYYEYLFWGGGHLLQFAYTQMLLLAWLMLLRGSGAVIPFSPRVINGLLLLGLLPILWALVIYAQYDPVSGEMRVAFTRLMQYGGGIPAVPLGLLLLYVLFRAPKPQDVQQRPLRLALWFSLVLFGAGGILAMLITGVNTVIPAHYHGSIVGVTLALMGLAYLLLPALGYEAVEGRLATLQPILYGSGQLLHITGLALSGFMGIQRKTAGAAQGLESIPAKLAMGVMGIGGLLAVIGGILFVWIMLRAFYRGRTVPNQAPSTGNNSTR